MDQPKTHYSKKQFSPTARLVRSSPIMTLVLHPELAPFLDLFSRMTDAQLSRLTGVDLARIHAQRKLVYDVMDRLEPFEDLLKRLDDVALARLAEEELATVAFWRTCCNAPSPGKRPPLSSAPPAPATADRDGISMPMDEDDGDEDDAFVLTIDDDDPPHAMGDDDLDGDDPMDWGDM